MPAEVKIQVYANGQEMSELSFNQPIIKIGRLSSAHIKLDDPTVSRVHAVIETDPEGNVTVRDMKSSSGIVVNGTRISDEARLRNGDEVLVGKTKLVIRFAAPAPGPVLAPVAQPIRESREDISTLEVAQDLRPAAPPPAPTPAVLPVESPAPRPMMPRIDPDSVSARMKRVEPARPRPVQEHGIGPMLDFDQYEKEEATGSDRVLQIKVMWEGAPLDIYKFKAPSKVVLGGMLKRAGEPRLPYDLEGVPADFPIVRTVSNETVLLWPEFVTGEVMVSGARKTLANLIEERRAKPDSQYPGCHSYILPPEAQARLEFPGTEFHFRFVNRPKIPPGAHFTVDLGFLNSLISSFLMTAMAVLVILLMPTDLTEGEGEALQTQNVFEQLALVEEQKKEDKKQKLQGEKRDEAKKEAKDEGKAGKVNEKQRETMMQSKAVDPKDKERVRTAGVLGFLNKGFAGADNLIGAKGLGGEMENFLAGITGGVGADSGGMMGGGLAGLGGGGGGDGTGTYGLGGVGTLGRGGEGGYGLDVGAKAKGEKKLNIEGGAPEIYGSLDKEIIRRVIRAHANEIRYCYEKELIRSPGLFGKVTVTFVINKDGGVENERIKDTELNNEDVETCMLRKLKFWKFPEPKGGGKVIVTYPFILKRSG
ncbi:MAG: hypothetical protein GMKNLPBB_01391 [Myxococcota bacterium]|nr:hypothetical protein [Myxococcota bacterium]